jgi:hypothetical protein
MEQNNAVNKRAGKGRRSGPPWNWYRILLVIVPALIPVIYFFLSGKESLVFRDLAIVGLIFTLYWVILFVIATRILRHKKGMHALSMASPLIELPLTAELRSRLSDFAAARKQKPAVVAFEILDREIPRFEPEGERDRALRDNEQLPGNPLRPEGAFLVAVTTEILKRLLLLSGAQEEDRKLWHSHISETAARIVSNALDHRIPVTD